MQILIIRATNAIGGAEIYNLNLIKAFRKYYPEDKLFFITTLPEFSRRIKDEEAGVITLSVFSEEVGTKKGLLRLFYHLPKYFYFYLKTILKFRQKEKIKAICLQSATEKIFLSPILKILGFKVIWIEHGPFFSFPTTKTVLFLYKIASHFSSKIITVSQNTLKDAQKGGINKNKLICVRTGVDPSHFYLLSEKTSTEIKRKIKLARKNMTVGYVGDFNKWKGVNEFLEVVKEIVKKMGGIRFILVGRGELSSWINRVIKRNSLEKIFLLPGFKKDVRFYLGIFDVIFYLNRIGSISMVLLEAMAMGVPVVARDIGGNRELVVHGKTGYLFKDETPEELADTIVDLLKDEKKRKTMGKVARERIVKYFNEERWIRELHAVFEEVVKE